MPTTNLAYVTKERKEKKLTRPLRVRRAWPIAEQRSQTCRQNQISPVSHVGEPRDEMNRHSAGKNELQQSNRQMHPRCCWRSTCSMALPAGVVRQTPRPSELLLQLLFFAGSLAPVPCSP